VPAIDVRQIADIRWGGGQIEFARRFISLSSKVAI